MTLEMFFVVLLIKWHWLRCSHPLILSLCSLRSDFYILKILPFLPPYTGLSHLQCEPLYLLQGWVKRGSGGRKGKLLLEGPVQFPAKHSGGWNAKYVPFPCFLTLCCMPLLQAGVRLESKNPYGFVSSNILYPSGRNSSVVCGILKTFCDAAACRDPL